MVKRYMNTKNSWLRLLVIALAIPALVLNGWLLLLTLEYFKSIINIFVTATLLSFLLDYPVQRLQSYGLKRTIAILGVLLITLIILSILGITLIPMIFQQFNTLIERLPSWIESGIQQVKTIESWAMSRNIPVNIGGVTSQLLEKLSSQVSEFRRRCHWRGNNGVWASIRSSYYGRYDLLSIITWRSALGRFI